MTMNQTSLNIDNYELVAVAEAAAWTAGELVRNIFGETRHVENKGFRDLVTDADLAAQKVITSEILRNFPDHGFLTEEKDQSLPSDGPIIWIIDPIDGTTNYSRQIPVYSISIAAAVNNSFSKQAQDRRTGDVLCGVIYDPATGETFSSGLGLGSHLITDPGRDKRPIRVSSIPRIELAMIGLDWGRSFTSRKTMLDELSRFLNEAHSVRAMGSAALALAWVAAGRLDAYYNMGIGPWDVAAAEVIIGEAGGMITTQDGSTWHLEQKGCVASNGLVHESFLRILQV
jgi:myo-inositol-1(or 4)-monophosphatase